MNSIKKLILIFITALFASFAVAQSLPADLLDVESLRAVSLSLTPNVFPDADLLLLDDVTRVRYEPDGSEKYVSDMAYKIFTEKGRQEKSAVRISYRTSYGIARFNRAEIIKPDGRIVPVNLEVQTRETIDQSQMNANIYDPGHKVIQLTVPDLGIGDILRYTVSGENHKTVVPGTWSEIFVFEDKNPIRRAVYEVDAPAALPPVRIELKDEIPGTVHASKTDAGDRMIYRWEVRNVPRMFEEPGMPAAYMVAQRLLLSTIPDWESLSKWYWHLSVPRLEKTNDVMAAKVNELIAGAAGRREKIETIFRFVSQEIRYMGLTLEEEAPGYEPHDVDLTFNNRYGVCRDKAALLVTMLNLAGVEARPVLINVGPKKDAEVPQPWFNHAITAVRDGGGWLLMDPTNENTRDPLPGYLYNRSYLVATPEGETLYTSTVMPPEDNLLTITVDAALAGENLITGTAELNFGGVNDTIYRGRLATLKPEERRPYFEERLKQAFGSARLIEFKILPEEVRDTTQPLQLTLRFEIDHALAAGADESVFQIPTLLNQFGLFGRLIGAGVGLERRRYPLQIQLTCGTKETVRLDLSRSGKTVVTLPEYETIDTPQLYISRHAEAAGDVISATAAVMLRTVEFSPEEYLTLKQNLKISERNARQRTVLANSGFPPDADVAILDEKVFYTFANPQQWREDRFVKRKVLTYAGKNETADLHLAYNTGMAQAVLNYAVVTAPDGTEKSIDPNTEVNLMDARWCGEAPRYPAEKILVATLPGVEIGSVIDTHTTVFYTNMPFFSTAELLGSFNPSASKIIQFRAPHHIQIQFLPSDPFIQRRVFHEGDLTVYEWSLNHPPQIVPEDHLPPLWLAAPAVLASTGDLHEYTAQVRKALENAAGESKNTRKFVTKITGNAKSRDLKIKAIRDFVDRTVRAAGPGFSQLPLSAISSADRTLAEGYGGSADRAVLLYALLAEARLNPRFILSSELPRSTGAVNQPGIAALQRDEFNTVLVAVENDAKQKIYLGDTGQYAVPGTLQHTLRPSINLHSGAIEFPAPVIPDGTERVYTIALDETGAAEMKVSETFRGTDFELFHRRFAQFTPEEKRRAYQSMLTGISQSARAAGELTTTFENPGKLEFTAVVDALAMRAGDRMYFNLPGGLGDLLGLRASKRTHPFYIETAVNRIVAYDIAIPAGWEISVMPKTVRIELPANAGFVEVRSGVSDTGRLVIVQQAQLLPAIIPAEEYGRLLHLNDQLTAPAADTVMLKKRAVR
ncbi:MAG: DUF3857 domain-containing protein [Kiritimatiellales bacterium]